MNRKYIVPLIIVGFAIIVVFLIIRLQIISGRMTEEEQNAGTTLAHMKDSLSLVQRDLDTLKQQIPGLGEYMSAIQLHISKLWFAAKASNWDLSMYELNELREAVNGAKDLHLFKNNVNISAVLESVDETQLTELDESIALHDPEKFRNNYGETLTACNGCHQASGYKFIHIVVPKNEPVVNQQWNP